MPKVKYTLDSIEGGISPTLFGPQPKNTYDTALGIDPDLKSRVASGSRKTGGAITPSGFTKFSSTGLTGYPLWLTATAKDSLVYAYDSAGNFISYTSGLTGESVIGTPTNGVGNGMAYYNNYIYLATPTDISRYGPLDGVPSLTNAVWSGATFMNDANKVLKNSLYPYISGGTSALPNHAMKTHTDGFLYVCDVISNLYPSGVAAATQGKGVIHRISTKKVTAEGDTNNGSAYDVLELPFGYWPVALETYGTDLAIVAIPAANSNTLTLNRGRAVVFFWDTFASIPYKQVYIPDPVASAILNNNGKLYVFSGNTSAGVRVSQYDGADSFIQVAFQEEGASPYQGAVDAWEDRLIWGGYVTYPTTAACVFSLGSKNQAIDRNAVHNIAKTSSAGANPRVSALKYILQADNSSPNPIIGWGDDSSKGIDKYGTGATLSSQFQWKVDVGRPFTFVSLRLSLDTTVDSSISISPTIYVDDFTTTYSLTAITNSNYSGKQVIVYKRPELTVVGKETFYLNLTWGLTKGASVILPIEVELDVFDVLKTA